MVDWPGHGDSGLPAQDFGEVELVEAAKEIIGRSNTRYVVPVAAAHSDWVAIELRRQLGEMIPEVVLLDWLVLDPPPGFMRALKGLQTREHWQEVRDGLFREWLSENPNEKIAHYVQKEMGSLTMKCGHELDAKSRRIMTAFNRP